MKKGILLILLLISFEVVAQIDYTQYHSFIDSAMNEANTGKFQKASQLYSKAFLIKKPLQRDVTQSLTVALELNDWESVTFHYSLLMLKYGYKSTAIDNMINFKTSKQRTQLEKYKNSEQFNQLTSNYKLYQEIYKTMFNEIDSTLRNQVLLLIEEDQKYRRGSAEMFSTNIEKVRKVDHANLLALKEIIERNGGWPSFEVLGLGASPFVLVLHIENSDNPTLKYFDEVLKRAVKGGKLEKYYYDHFRSYKQINW